MALNIFTVRGKEIETYVPELAELRIKVFHDYPYLYEGNLDYEKKYLQTYIDCPESCLVVVQDGNKIIGASTALPLKAADKGFSKPFVKQKFDINKIFYFAESVLLHDYRGSGVGKRFFQERENAAREGGFYAATFCAVERPQDHPQKPADYTNLEPFWTKLGYAKHPELHTEFSWLDIGEKKETEKTMVFWLRYL